MGRKKKNTSMLWDGWQDDILLLYQEGGSDVEIRTLIYEKTGGAVRMSNDLWYRWIKDEEEFKSVIEFGKQLSESWWIKEGRKNLRSKSFNYTGWYMNMKNRFKWADRFDNTSKGKPIKTIVGMKIK